MSWIILASLTEKLKPSEQLWTKREVYYGSEG